MYAVVGGGCTDNTEAGRETNAQCGIFAVPILFALPRVSLTRSMADLLSRLPRDLRNKVGWDILALHPRHGVHASDLLRGRQALRFKVSRVSVWAEHGRDGAPMWLFEEEKIMPHFTHRRLCVYSDMFRERDFATLAPAHFARLHAKHGIRGGLSDLIVWIPTHFLSRDYMQCSPRWLCYPID